MITYDKKLFGANLLFRFSGSGVYRATLPGFLSVIALVLLKQMWHPSDEEIKEIDHPYTIGVLVASTTFLLVFRLQQAYARYWEAATAVHQMMSKWMDATMHAAVYHLQASQYEKIKPPSFFEYPELDEANLTRDRERSYFDMNRSNRIIGRSVKKSIEYVTSSTRSFIQGPAEDLRNSPKMEEEKPITKEQEDMNSIPLEGHGRLDGNWGNLFNDGKSTFFDANDPNKKDPQGFASSQGGRNPPLFIQELAHLSSLMLGVALSTLRNDVEGAESPLDIYIPGSEWPVMDPDLQPNLWSRHTVSQRILGYLGNGRTAEERTKYNAARPLPVLGGVSEAEIIFLQKARGPYAKTQLAWYWLSEFMVREHLSGSMGNVGPPIVSRCVQFLSDGMIHYNNARKVMNIPFPFPHAQLSVFYVCVSIPSLAILMDQYASELWLGSILTFLTVTCLAGIHEVARELENPFRNIPNELPVVTWQARFNEALITMYSGFHPDAFWRDAAEDFKQRRNNKMMPTKPAKTKEMEITADENSIWNKDEKLAVMMQKLDEQETELQRMRELVVRLEARIK